VASTIMKLLILQISPAPITASIFGPNILRSTLLSEILNLCSLISYLVLVRLSTCAHNSRILRQNIILNLILTVCNTILVNKYVISDNVGNWSCFNKVAYKCITKFITIIVFSSQWISMFWGKICKNVRRNSLYEHFFDISDRSDKLWVDFR
jgi:hypothetical protein